MEQIYHSDNVQKILDNQWVEGGIDRSHYSRYDVGKPQIPYKSLGWKKTFTLILPFVLAALCGEAPVEGKTLENNLKPATCYEQTYPEAYENIMHK